MDMGGGGGMMGGGMDGSMGYGGMDFGESHFPSPQLNKKG